MDDTHRVSSSAQNIRVPKRQQVIAKRNQMIFASQKVLNQRTLDKLGNNLLQTSSIGRTNGTILLSNKTANVVVSPTQSSITAGHMSRRMTVTKD